MTLGNETLVRSFLSSDSADMQYRASDPMRHHLTHTLSAVARAALALVFFSAAVQCLCVTHAISADTCGSCVESTKCCCSTDSELDQAPPALSPTLPAGFAAPSDLDPASSAAHHSCPAPGEISSAPAQQILPLAQGPPDPLYLSHVSLLL